MQPAFLTLCCFESFAVVLGIILVESLALVEVSFQVTSVEPSHLKDNNATVNNIINITAFTPYLFLDK